MQSINQSFGISTESPFVHFTGCACIQQMAAMHQDLKSVSVHLNRCQHLTFFWHLFIIITSLKLMLHSLSFMSVYYHTAAIEVPPYLNKSIWSVRSIDQVLATYVYTYIMDEGIPQLSFY